MLTFKKNSLLLLTALIGLLVLTACGSKAPPPPPTRTPMPTFTPTPEGQVISEPLTQPADQEIATALPQPVEPPPAESQPGESQPVEAPTAEPQPTDTPAPAPAEVVVNSIVNVRGGPGTNYNILGAAQPGERYPVTGRNDASDWWQIDYSGQVGWVFGQLVTPQNVETVAVAQNIPAPPPPTPAPPTATPQPAQPTAPPAPPQPQYEFNKAVVQRCDPNAGVTYVEGTTYKNGQPANGYNVAFSYAPDGPPVATIKSGPHEGYPGWRTGFYSHIIGSTGPREGDWYFWIVDGTGKRISAIAHIHTDGQAGDGKCQQGVIDFDS